MRKKWKKNYKNKSLKNLNSVHPCHGILFTTPTHKMKQRDGIAEILQYITEVAPSSTKLKIPNPNQSLSFRLGSEIQDFKRKLEVETVLTGVKGMVFINFKDKNYDSLLFCKNIFSKQPKSRFLSRIIPIKTSFLKNDVDLSKKIETFISNYIGTTYPNKNTIKSYNIIIEKRLTGKINIKIKDHVKKAIPYYFLHSYKSPQIVFCFYVIKNLILCAIMDEYQKYNSYKIKRKVLGKRKRGNESDNDKEEENQIDSDKIKKKRKIKKKIGNFNLL